MAAIIASFVGMQGSVSALTANYNDVIDDTVFDNADSMTASQIDTFLNTFPNSCISTNNGFTSPDPTGYNPSQGFVFGGNVSAGLVLYHAAQAYGINPQVLLATLQKEQSLVTGSAGCHPNNPDPSWPFSSSPAPGKTFTCNVNGHATTCTYACPDAFGGGCTNIALGYNCPGYCKAADENFSRQIIAASWLLTFDRHRSEGQNNWYVNKPNWDNSDDLGFCYSQYDVAGGPYYLCPDQNSHANDPFVSHSGQYVIDSSTVVTMTNGATAALFDYTPHLHGQDLFVTNFTNWFGPTTSLMNGITMTNITQPDSTPARGETVSYVFSLTNTFTFPVTLDAVGVVGRPGSPTSSTNRDFGWQGPVTLQPNTPQQFTFSTPLFDTGKTYAWPAILREGIYTQYNNWGASMNAHEPSITITTPLTSSVAKPLAGQDVTFSAILTNNEPQAINYDALGIPVRLNNNINYDAVWVGPGTIGAGQNITISGIRNTDKSGSYTYWVSDYFGGRYTTIGPVKQLDAIQPTPSFSVSGLNLSSTQPVKGQSLSATFTITNNLPVAMDVDAVGIVGRFGTFTGPNRDLNWQGPVHFDAGETKTFTETGTIPEAGTHYYWIGILYKGAYLQFNAWGSTVVGLSPSFSVSGLTFTNTSPAVSESLGASFTVTNNLPVPIDVAALGVVGRLGTFTGPNRDLNWQGPVHFDAGQTLSFTESGTIVEAGTHYYWIGILYDGSYLQYNNWGSTIVSHSTQ